MAMVESRIIAPIVTGRIERNPLTKHMRSAAHAVLHNRKPENNVAISGEGLLKQRLAHKTLNNAAIDNSTKVAAKPLIEQLSKKDRALISDLYVLAREQGTDLRYVDDLTKNLARYREQQSNPDKSVKEPRGYFNDTERGMLKRIRDSEALGSTRLDPDFIRHMTDPDNPRVHSDLAFMEQVMQRFSAQGAGESGLSSRFARYGDGPEPERSEAKKPLEMPGLFGMLAKAGD